MPESMRRHRQAAKLPPRSAPFKWTPSASQYALSSPATRVAEKKFDVESGLIFYESEVRPNRGRPTDWIREFSTPHVVTKPVPNSNGARSLSDIARTKVVQEFPNLSSEHLATVPWSVAEKIWDKVVET